MVLPAPPGDLILYPERDPLERTYAIDPVAVGTYMKLASWPSYDSQSRAALGTPRTGDPYRVWSVGSRFDLFEP